MANSDKNVLITPNTGTANKPAIRFTGANNNPVTLHVEDTGALSIEGSAGQLFYITDSLTGTIFSVNDAFGVPSIDVQDNGNIRLAPFSGKVGVGKTAAYSLDVAGVVNASALYVNGEAVGGMHLLASGALSGASISVSNIPQFYKELVLHVDNFRPATDATGLALRINADATASRYATSLSSVASDTATTFGATFIQISGATDNTTTSGLTRVVIPRYTNGTTWKVVEFYGFGTDPTTTTSWRKYQGLGVYNQVAAVNNITLLPVSGNFTSGNYFLYGVR